MLILTLLSFLAVVVGCLTATIAALRLVRSIAPANDHVSHRRLVAGMLLLFAGVVTLASSTQFDVWPSWFESDTKPVTEFSLTSRYPDANAVVGRTAIINLELNEPVEENAPLGVQVFLKDGEAFVPVPGLTQVLHRTDLATGTPGSTIQFQPATTCGDESEQSCFAVGTYHVEVNPSKLRSLVGSNVVKCGDACVWDFTVEDRIDATSPAVTAPNDVTLPITEKADVALSLKDGSPFVRLSFVLSPGQVGEREVGTFLATPGEVVVPLPTSSLKNNTTYFLSVQADDFNGNVSETRTVIAARTAHCVNAEKDADEVDVDCGGASCPFCQTVAAEE